MAKRSSDLEDVSQDYRIFPEEFESLLMATSNSYGLPEASYAAYLEEEGDYYVYLSELARHTGYLQANPKCSVMFIENEQDASHLFARRRLTYQCEANEIDRDSARFDSILDAFEGKFGEFIKMLRNMDDFHLFRLKPFCGRYVSGFAQAYEIGGEQMETIKHRNEKGHRPK